MITPSEWVWLKNKRTYCNHCVNEERDDDCEWDIAMGRCPILNSFEQALEALEFAERVVTKLAGILDRTLRSRDYTLHADCTRVCPAATDCTKNNQLGLDCAPYLLKWARLAVEEEMDSE